MTRVMQEHGGTSMRIVSLIPSATEIACALGLREQLVGVSHECDYPEGVEGLPILTASILAAGLEPRAIDEAVRRAQLEARPLYTVDGAALEDLRPDLILTQGVCSVCAVTPATIDAALELRPLAAQLSDRVELLSLSATSFAGILADIRAVAAAAGVTERGEALVAELGARWSSLADRPIAARPAVMLLEWPDPPWFPGHWVPEQIAAAGGRTILGGVGVDSRSTTWEAIAASDPDWLIAAACGYDLATNLAHARELLNHPIVAGLRAVRERRFWAVDANSYFSRPGPRVVRGAEILGDLLRANEAALADHEAARV